MKEPLFTLLREEGNPKRLVDPIWTVTKLRDKLGPYTTEVYAQSREDILNRQAQELLELSTPVVELWDKIILLPLIGMLDSERTQVVMENLLSQIVKCRADIAIVDISGVPTVDTLVAQHPHQDRLGRPPDGRRLHHKRHTPIVHLGLQLDVVSKATMADAFALALQRTRHAVGSTATEPAGFPSPTKNQGAPSMIQGSASVACHRDRVDA